MRAPGRMLAFLLLMILLAQVSCAEDARRVYGGRGEDRLLYIAEAGGGLFAAGMTMSSDGDLSARRRTGETGWAMLIDETGERVWNYTSARSGMARMIDPVPLDDGRFSVLLTDDDAQRYDWILLTADGGLLSRMEVSAKTFGVETGFSVLAALLVDQEPAKIAVFARRESDGAVCALSLDEMGRPQALGNFLPADGGAAATDHHGNLAYVGANAGCMSVTRLTGMMESSAVRFADFDVTAVSDALMQDDGSIVCCGKAQTEQGACGFSARVSREGEVLFAHAFVQPQRHICQTETGYAVCGAWQAGAGIAFLDEDGGLLADAALADAAVLDIAGVPGGCAALTHLDGHRQRQAAVTHVYQEQHAGLGLLIGREEAMRQEDDTDAAPEIMLENGCLLCSGDSAGVQVTLIGDSGEAVWSTRIPIHTAADALEWLCAARCSDGSVLLGGRYLTEEGGAVSQQGAAALLSSDGVLRRIEEIGGLGAVTAIELLGDAGALLVGSGDDAGMSDVAAHAEFTW